MIQVGIWFFILFSLNIRAESFFWPEIGEHYKIVTLEKNENPQNILIVYTKLDKNCLLITQKNLPLVEVYWLMNKVRYKRTHALIRRAIRKRLEITKVDLGRQAFSLMIHDLQELNSDLVYSSLRIETKKLGLKCQVQSYYSDKKSGGEDLQVSALIIESQKTFRPPFRKVVAVTIKGSSPSTGEPVERKYSTK